MQLGPLVTMVTLRQTNQPSVTAGLAPLSSHYLMLIRPQQALLLARIYCKPFFQYKEILELGMVYIKKTGQSELFFAYSYFVQYTIL